MRPFHPDKQRELLLECFGLERDFKADINEVRAKNALSGWGDGMVTDGVRCLLVGFDEEGVKVLQKARQFLRLSLEKNEVSSAWGGRSGTEMACFEGLALCQWLLDGVDDRLSLHQLVLNRLEFLESCRNAKREINLTLPMFLEAGEHEKCVELFDSTPGLEPPTDPQRITSEGKMAYALSRYRFGVSDYTWEQLEPAIRRFLKRQVLNWLSNGWYTDAARWMKILFWQPDPTRMTPKDALLKCYDYLPPKVRQRGLALARGEM